MTKRRITEGLPDLLVALAVQLVTAAITAISEAVAKGQAKKREKRWKAEKKRAPVRYTPAYRVTAEGVTEVYRDGKWRPVGAEKGE